MKIIAGIIKGVVWFFRRIFGFRNVLYSDLERYRRRGLCGRIFTMIYLTGFCILTVLLEKWMADMFLENILLGILLVLVFLIFAMSTMKMVFIHILVGFKSARITKKEQCAFAKLKLESHKDKGGNLEVVDDGSNMDVSVLANNYRRFDLLFGWYNILLFVGLVAGIVVCFSVCVLGV